ncbi:permease prefix domain 1-containing protein [Promicromonospora kroppenstedtii]|uniref:permease prefix domain 1-containing protein n=1 Tax=Promicromonospora kroppenstedtii TaxID=440482 RepID=UPI0004ADBB26|nr:permease prefix domain 1-containing protein [Promicromonospora kroppenstedtii]
MNTLVHRLLDEAFAGLPATDDVQDLKEEIRVNLLDRVAELTASGADGDAAARRAVEELGDVRALVDGGSVRDTAPGERLSLRPSRRYTIGVVIASAVVLSPFVGVLIALAGNIYGMIPLLVGALLAGPAIGWIVGATLVRETRTRYGMPRQRAIAYGFASALVALSVFVGTAGYTSSMNPFYAMMMLPVLLVGGAWLAYLLASQTNRRKPWVLERARERAGSRASGPGDSRPSLP